MIQARTRTAGDLWAGDAPPDPVKSCAVTFSRESYPSEVDLDHLREWTERRFPLFPGKPTIRKVKDGWTVRWPLDIDPDAEEIIAHGS